MRGGSCLASAACPLQSLCTRDSPFRETPFNTCCRYVAYRIGSETVRFTLDIERNITRATADINVALNHPNDPYAPAQPADAPRATWKDFFNYFGRMQNLRILFGTAYSWFAIDVRHSPILYFLKGLLNLVRQVAFYTLGLNASVILEAIGFGVSGDVFKNLRNLCIGNLILSLAGLIPGYWLCFLFIDSWGQKSIQLMGFSVLTCLFAIMGRSSIHSFTRRPIC